LLVEDNAAQRASLQQLLSPRFMVEAVADGRTALQAALQRRPDLVLSTARSRSLDGIALTRALRADPITHALPILLMLGRNQRDLAIEITEAGADGYLVKPFAPGELVARVSGRIAQWRLRAQLALDVARRRLADELHDQLAQTLVGADLVIAGLLGADAPRPNENRPQLEHLRSLMRVALADMQVILNEMRPETLEQKGLGELIEHLAEFIKARLPVDVLLSRSDVDRRSLSTDVKHAFYRIAQEILANIEKHAGASRVEIHLTITAAGAEMRILDDGVGFDPREPHEGTGLLTMRERAASVHMELTITSSKGRGTEVIAHWVRPAYPGEGQ
jgi:signal transduction histidine kinase